MPPAVPPSPVVQAFPAPAQPAPLAAYSEQGVAAAIAHAEMPSGNIQRQPAPAPPLQQATQPVPRPTPPAPQPTSQPTPQQPAIHEDPSDPIPWRRLSRIAEMHKQRKTQEDGPRTADSGPQTADSGPQTADSGPRTADGQQRSVDSSQEDSTRQQVPLEAAWPVQRDPQVEKTTSPTPEDSPAGAAAGQALQRAPEDKETEQQLRTRLESVKAARPSDSSVELHLPRRPRPTPPGAAQQGASAEQQQQTPPVQRQPQPETVPTEIGPLPADMWELLGQTPPTTEQTTQPSNNPTSQPANDPTSQPGNTPAASIQRAIDAAEKKAEPASRPAPEQATGQTPPAAPQLPSRPPAQTETAQPAAGSKPAEITPAPPPVSEPPASQAPPTVARQSEDNPPAPAVPSGNEPAVGPQQPEAAQPETTVQRQPDTETGIGLDGTPQATAEQTPDSAPAQDEPAAEQAQSPISESPTPAPTSEEASEGASEGAIARAIAAAEQPPAADSPSPQQPGAQKHQTQQSPKPARVPKPDSAPAQQPLQRKSQPGDGSRSTPTANREQQPTAATTGPEAHRPEPPRTDAAEAPRQRAPQTPESPVTASQTDVARQPASEADSDVSPEGTSTVVDRQQPSGNDSPAPGAERGAEPGKISDDAPRTNETESLAVQPSFQPPTLQREAEEKVPSAPTPVDEEAIVRAIAAAEAPDTPPSATTSQTNQPAQSGQRRAAGGAPASLPASGDQDGRGPTEPTPTPSQTAASAPQQKAVIARRIPDQPSITPTTPVIARLLPEPQEPVPAQAAGSLTEQDETGSAAPGFSDAPIAAHDNAIERAITAAEQPSRPQAPRAAPLQRTPSGQFGTQQPLNKGLKPQPAPPSQPVLARAATPTHTGPAARASTIRRQAESYPQDPSAARPSWSTTEPTPAPVVAHPVRTTPAATATPALQRTAVEEPAVGSDFGEPATQTETGVVPLPPRGAEAPTMNQGRHLETAATLQATNRETTQQPDQRNTQLSNHPTTQQTSQVHSPISNSPVTNPPTPLANIHRAIAAAERPAPPQPLPASGAPIQRALVEEKDEDEDEFNLRELFDEAPGPSTAQERDTGIETYEEPQKPQVDVEELAQRVYSTLRRRLAVDWERERGRR